MMFTEDAKMETKRVIVKGFDLRPPGQFVVFGNRLCQVEPSSGGLEEREWAVSLEEESFFVQWVYDELVVLPVSRKSERCFWPEFTCFVRIESDDPILSPNPLLHFHSKRYRVMRLADRIWETTRKFLEKSKSKEGKDVLKEAPFDEDVLVGWLLLVRHRGCTLRCVVEGHFSPFTEVFGPYHFCSIKDFSEDGWGVVKWKNGFKHYLEQMVFDFNTQKKELKMTLYKKIQSPLGYFGEII